MASPFPEGNSPQAGDNEWYCTYKWCALLYAKFGNRTSPFPDGTAPSISDNEETLEKKINIMLE